MSKRKPLEKLLTQMSDEEKEYVCSCIDKEGMDYCFEAFSDFNEIKDPEFHRLRIAYNKAADKLAKYIEFDTWINEDE